MIAGDNDAEALVSQLLADAPSFHAGGTVRWDATPGTLHLIGRSIQPGGTTLETGCGASTVIFAAANGEHTAISPFPDEHRLIETYCRERVRADLGGLRFIAGSSDAVLPGLVPDRPLDCVFIDGAHCFPHAIVDAHYATRHLRVGGTLILDDVPIPAVRVVYDFLSSSDEWELIEIVDDRAASFRKSAEPPGGDFWQLQPYNRRWPDFSFLPPGRRVELTATTRVKAAGGRFLRRHPKAAEWVDGLRRRG